MRGEQGRKNKVQSVVLDGRHEEDLILSLLADAESFFHARNAGLNSADIADADIRGIWIAAEKSVAASETPDPGNLLRFGAPEAPLLTFIGREPTTIGLKRAITSILLSARQRRLHARIEKARELASDTDTISDAIALLGAPFDSVQSQSLGDGATAAALCAKPPPAPPQLISGILYAGGTMMLSGPSKAHKTYTFLDLGVSVATGTEWLGYGTNAAGVIYLNFELPEHAFAQRLNAICSAKGVDAPSNFRSFNLRGRSATMGLLEVELPRLIRSQAVGLVVLDPWYKLSATSGAEENSNDGQTRILAEAERIVTSNGAALVVGHHFAKGDASSKNSIDRAAGAGAMARWGDVIATLTEHEEPEAMTLEVHLRCFAPVPPTVLRWEHPIWRRDESLDPAKLRKAGRSDAHPASKAIEVLRDGMTAKEWRERLGWSDTTMRRKIGELEAAGAVNRQSGAFYHAKR